MIVHNPRASHHAKVETEVLGVLRGLSGWMVGKYQIKPTGFDENVKQLAKVLTDDTLMIVAGGDGTAAIAINSVLESGKDVTVGVLGYGNFNDIAGMLGAENAQEILQKYEQGAVRDLYALEVWLDGERWRYAPSYCTVGMFAQSTEVFEEEKVRQKLRTGKKGLNFSIWQLAKWYFRHHRKCVLPAGELNGEALPKKATDYIALNGRTMARVMKGGEWYGQEKDFLSSVQRLGSFGRLMKFMMTSMRKQVPGKMSERDVLTFAEPSRVEIHAEGEFARVEVQEIEVKKAVRPVKVIVSRN